ncbi:LLM class flavin-dependent oxidoreductase [Desertibaculum subflavum]|uniref:LLM class flavin-dependent oxidoreductase n=1 Tax=Desertibaculum subflavum TaxID=2268458 RepID=UPI000E66AAC5
MTGKLAFGIFDHVERRGPDIAALYRGRFALAQAAESFGFRGYHVAEHHATPLGMAPSPALFLAALAQRTSKLRLGPLVYLLPLYEPMRLAEEICMLDHLSGGRLDLGVGRGVSPYELAVFRVPFYESRARFAEALDLMLAALTRERIDHHGRFYQIDDVPIAMRPLQSPHPPLWFGGATEKNAEFAGARGMNLMSNGPNVLLRRQMQIHAEHWRPGAANPLPVRGAIRHLLVAETDAEAERLARPAYKVFYDNIVKLWREWRTAPINFTDDLDRARANQVAIVGSPQTVKAEIERFAAESGCDYLALSFVWGDLSDEIGRRSLDLFGREVMPGFA